jgi:glycosyltransferase involved in cell wall biosynthesis
VSNSCSLIFQCIRNGGRLKRSPLKILFLHTNRQWGGGEVWLSQIVDALEENGHEVLIASRPGSALLEHFKPRRASLIPFRISGDFDPITVGRLAHLIRKENVELVCAHTDKELRVGGLATRLAGIPIVVSREVDLPVKDTRVNRLFYGSIASAIIVNSFATKNTLLNSVPSLREKPIYVIWKGVDPAVFRTSPPAHLRDEFHLGEEDVLAGFVGRLDEQKGIMTLIEAMALVAPRTDRLRLVIAGEGNLRGAIERYVHKWKLERSVILAGFRDDTIAFMRAIDFLVMPSNWEGFGYSAVEAMAAGKPVIASTASSLPEIVQHSRTGILVPPRSPESLAQAIITFARFPALGKEFGRAGAARVRRLFTLTSTVRRVESVYRRVIRLEKSSDGGRLSAHRIHAD